MKVAVLSDVHGNLAALEAVVADLDLWDPDLVVVNGDVLNQGPYPERCLRLIEARRRADGWILLRGNHEDFVLAAGAGTDAALCAPRRALFRSSYWTRARLTAAELAALALWPDRYELANGDRPLVVMHASIHSNVDGLVPRMPDAELTTKIDRTAAVFVTGHTHMFFARQLGDTLLVNCGSVGRPLDGDTRTGYARLSDDARGWRAELVRLTYDRQRLERDLHESGFLADCWPFSALLQAEWRDARCHFPNWRRRYETAFLAGEVSAEESVRAHIASTTGP